MIPVTGGLGTIADTLPNDTDKPARTRTSPGSPPTPAFDVPAAVADYVAWRAGHAF
jgi:hypothetical protein